MKKNQLDLYMILLLFITLTVWLLKDISFIFGFIVYLGIFTYLFIKKRPISHFFVVILFSVMSLRSDTGSFKMDYALVMILFGLVVIQSIKDKKIVFGNLFIPLVIFLTYSMISIIWTPVKSTGFHGLVAMLEGYMVYFILTNGNFKITKNNFLDISKIATYVMLTLTLELLYIYYIHGFEKVINRKKLIDVGWGFSNLIAIIFVFLFPIALYKYLDKKNKHYAYFFLDILNLIGLILTVSRGAFLGVGISLLIFTCLYVRKEFIIRYGSILGASGLIGILFIYLVKKSLFNRFISAINTLFTSKEIFDDPNRMPLYEVAVKTFLDKPIFGNGLKSSKYLIYHHLDGRINVHFHNFILQIASTLGIVGLILFGYLVYKWIKVIYKPKDVFVVCSGLSIIGALIHQLFDSSFDLFYFGVFFYGIFALVEIYRHYLSDDELKLTIYENK